MSRRATPERLSTFTDGCSPLLITVPVLELRPPRAAHFRDVAGSLADVAELRGELLFIAIVWANHRYPMRCASEATPSLLWFNFAHLFFDVAASALYCLDGVERTRAAAGGLLRDCLLFGERDLYRADVGAHSSDARREDSTKGVQDHAHAVRDDICLFGAAAVAALKYPLVGLGICICCLIGYLKPEPR